MLSRQRVEAEGGAGSATAAKGLELEEAEARELPAIA